MRGRLRKVKLNLRGVTRVCQSVGHGCLRSKQQPPAARLTAAMFHKRLGMRYEKSRFVPKMVTKRLSISSRNSDSSHAKTEQTRLKRIAA